MHIINCGVSSTSATDLGFVFNHLVYGYRRAAMLQPHIGPTLSAITLILYACAKMYVYTYVSQGERSSHSLLIMYIGFHLYLYTVAIYIRIAMLPLLPPPHGLPHPFQDCTVKDSHSDVPVALHSLVLVSCCPNSEGHKAFHRFNSHELSFLLQEELKCLLVCKSMTST